MENKMLYSGIVILTILSIYLLYERNELNYTNNYINSESLSYKNILENKSKIENKKIWETGIFDKTEYDNFIKLYGKKDRIFFLYDSVGCLKCYNFHKNMLNNKFSEENFVIVDYSKFSFLKKDFYRARFISAKENRSNYSQLLLLVDKTGKILYSDFPQFENLKYSSLFYKRYLSSVKVKN